MTRKKIQTVKSAKNVFRIKLPSETSNLDIIRKFISGIAENMGFSEEDVYKIELAVDEACSNVIRHAYQGLNDREKIIDITVRTKADRIEIVVADHGQGFDPDKLPTPKIEEYMKKMKRGGLGIYLMKTLMDRVRFKINPGVRNEVKLVKFLGN